MGRDGGVDQAPGHFKIKGWGGAACLAAFESGPKVNSQVETLTFSLDEGQESD